MATVAEMASGIETRLLTIAGLRANSYPPQQIIPPHAFVVLAEGEFGPAMGRGLDVYTFEVYVFTGAQVDRAGYKALTAYADPTGTSSIRSAVWDGRTLALTNTDASVTGFRFLSLEEVAIFGAYGGVFTVQVATKGA